ncbi:hypothetical protein [Ferrimicrobium sp.]|uniref:hypothetical protein n=1 Tax=Ferrimicrobium sp. TaxID=2926050 RepID=UPI0026039D63|nr:hypothetical protein [Ferrimicrobium sp.]
MTTLETTSTYRIFTRRESQQADVYLSGAAIAVEAPEVHPLTVAKDQLYYWSKAWQDEEQKALEDIRHGRVTHIRSAADLEAWLLD